MDDPRTVIRQMEAPHTVSEIDICRDGGTVVFDVTDQKGVTLAATLVTPFRGTPRRLTLGMSRLEPPNLVRISRFALRPGGPTEALFHSILKHWLVSLDRVTTPYGVGHIETVLNELQNRLGTTETDDLEELNEQRVRTWPG
jgi:hypothetical protein